MPFSINLKGGDEMILLSDTRQQIGKHSNIERYCRSHGITIVKQKLDVGDYMLPEDATGNPRVSVDTKQDL